MLYIVDMLRFGNDESHHYVLGVYSTIEGANFAGDAEQRWRGGKYEKRIIQTELNAPVPNAWIDSFN